MIATNIQWDVDKEDIDLPKNILIPIDMTDEDEISDYLSKETGFCHKGYDLVENYMVIEFELNRKWIYDKQGEEIGETIFIVPGEWLARMHNEYFIAKYNSFEEFLNLYEPEEEGEFLYKKAIEDKVLIEDIGIVYFNIPCNF